MEGSRAGGHGRDVDGTSMLLAIIIYASELPFISSFHTFDTQSTAHLPSPSLHLCRGAGGVLDSHSLLADLPLLLLATQSAVFDSPRTSPTSICLVRGSWGGGGSSLIVLGLLGLLTARRRIEHAVCAVEPPRVCFCAHRQHQGVRGQHCIAGVVPAPEALAGAPQRQLTGLLPRLAPGTAGRGSIISRLKWTPFDFLW